MFRIQSVYGQHWLRAVALVTELAPALSLSLAPGVNVTFRVLFFILLYASKQALSTVNFDCSANSYQIQKNLF